MHFSRKVPVFASIALLAFSLAGCAGSELIKVRPGSDKVVLANPGQVSGCQSRGKVTVSVLAKVGFVTRSVTDIDANLLQLARNAAIDAGGDTVVKGARPKLGKRTFSIYKCRP